MQITFLLIFTAEKYKDLVLDNAKADNATKNAEPLINLDGEYLKG